MGIQWGVEYQGPGRIDPRKTRGERELELLVLARTPDGREVIEYYFGKYTGTLQRSCPPVGLLMVQTILGYEYPRQ